MKLDIQVCKTYSHEHSPKLFVIEATCNVEGGGARITLPIENTEENRKRFHHGAEVTVTIE